MVRNGFLHCCADFRQEKSEHLRTFNLHPHDAHLSDCIITPSSTAPTSLQHDDGLEVCSNSSEHDVSRGRVKNAELCDKFSLHTVVVVLAKLSGNFYAIFQAATCRSEAVIRWVKFLSLFPFSWLSRTRREVNLLISSSALTPSRACS